GSGFRFGRTAWGRVVDGDLAAVVLGGLDHRTQQPQVVYAVCEAGGPLEPLDAGDLFQERAGLEHEQVVLAVVDAGEVHRQAAGDVGVLRTHQDLPVTLGDKVRRAVDVLE